VGKPEGRRLLGRPGEVKVRGIFRRWDVRAWIGSIWLRIGTGGGHL